MGFLRGVNRMDDGKFEPVINAEWVKVFDGVYHADGTPCVHFECTHCRFQWGSEYAVKHKFKRCPNCGAKMKGGTE